MSDPGATLSLTRGIQVDFSLLCMRRCQRLSEGWVWGVGSTNRFSLLLLIRCCKSVWTILKSCVIESHSRYGSLFVELASWSSTVPGALLKARCVSKVKAVFPFASCIPVQREQEQIAFNCHWVIGFWEKPVPCLLLQKQGISAMNQVPTPSSWAIYLKPFCLQIQYA